MNGVIAKAAGVVGVLATCGGVAAAVKTEPVAYKDETTQLEGYLAYEESADLRRPLVLVVHEWRGLDDYAKRRARQIAELGYVAFAVDMYGKGVVAANRQEAARLAGTYKSDRPLMRRRITAGLNAVKDHPRVDADRMAAIGYCFGGTVALELARSGADLDGVVSFHGGLDTPDPAVGRNIRAKVLVLTGADDRSVPLSQIADYMDEMRKGEVDYQIVIYGGAVHAFTNPAAGDDPSTNAAYNAKADRRSWEAMKDFLAEIFRKPPVRSP